jgi:hypothetical protein
MLYWLDTDAGDPALLGGKAIGLNRLALLGFPTPAGFCLTTMAYQHYLNASGCADHVTTLAAKLPDESARQELAALAFAHPLPADLSAALDDGLVGLSKGCGPRRYSRFDPPPRTRMQPQHHSRASTKVRSESPMLRLKPPFVSAGLPCGRWEQSLIGCVEVPEALTL